MCTSTVYERTETRTFNKNFVKDVGIKNTDWNEQFDGFYDLDF